MPELEEEEQEKMMLCLFQAFGSQPRKACLRKQNTKSAKRKVVRWSAEVDEMEKSHHVTVYPKETISKSLFHVEDQKKQVQETGKTSEKIREWVKNPPLAEV